MRSLAFLLACFSLTACGPDLGEPTFQDVSWSETLPKSVSHTRKDDGYLVLRFRSEADLNGEELNALYAKGSLCPWDRDESIPILGPFSVGSEPQYLPLFDYDGKAHQEYLVYVPISGEVYGGLKNGRWPVIGQYDLRQTERDLCVLVEHTGYPWATRSSVTKLAMPALLRQIQE